MLRTDRTLARRVGEGTAVALALSLASGIAHAQSAPADRIDAIERQIRNLQSELKQLKGELARSRGDAQQAREELRQSRAAASRAQQDAADAAAATARAAAAATQAQAVAAQAQAASAAAPPAKPGPKVVQTAGNRFGIESADGQNSIYLTGRLHFDAADYLSYDPQSRFAAVQNLNSGVNARRARIGVTGKFLSDWDYTLIFDFGGSQDTGNSSAVQNAFVTYNGLKKHDLLPVALDLGYMDTPFTLAEATSSNDILMLERPSITVVAMNLFAGDFRSAFGARSNDDRYWAGVYVTGPTSGTPHNTPQSFGAFGRATYQVLQGKDDTGQDYSVHLGGDVGALLHPPAPSNNVATVTLSDRPELRVDPTQILNTGALGTATNPVTGAQVYGVEAAAAWRNFFLQSEYYTINLDRRGLQQNNFNGYYVEGSWVITGENRRYNASSGAYSNPIPARPFEPWSDNYGLGAFELAGRYSVINLNDRFASGLTTPSGIGGGRQNVASVDLIWYPNRNMRFMLEFLHGNIAKNYSTAAGGGVAGTPLGEPIGGRVNALALRTQIAF
jgi:phosphate-selective porin OprO and OprP